jgi:PAS domain S-box-containing protein
MMSGNLLRFIVKLAARDDAVLITDRNGNVAYLNPSCERMLGVARQLAHDRPLRELVAVLRHATRAERAQGHVGARGGAWRRIRPDGRCLEIEASMRRFVDETGHATHLVYTLRAVVVHDDVARLLDNGTAVQYRPAYDGVAETA